MFSISWWDQFKMYENQNGIGAYCERIMCKIVNKCQRAYCRTLTPNQISQKLRAEDARVIISLTTFPARIGYVHLAIKSLLNQTVKPGKVILWLAKEQFRDVQIPEHLQKLCEYGLEIRYCEEDLLAHKKYYYAMREFPDYIIVTYDDDLIYPEDSLEKLLKMHDRYPKAIICNRGREIEVENGEVMPYRYWKVSGRVPAGKPCYRVVVSTGAGALYPPRCMPEETFDVAKIRQLALTADDLWMKVMSVKGQIPVVKSQARGKALCLSKSRQNVTLAHQNVEQNMNDHVMQDLLNYYPEVRQALLDEMK